MKKNLIVVLSLVMALTMMLTGCGKENVPVETTAATVAATIAPTVAQETAAPQPLTLTGWEMTANTWSSPNGATINVSAVPNYYEEGQQADFVVRLESDDVASVPCKWEPNNTYSASVDLNAANGYCYYVILTAADGTVTEVAVNTPAAPTNEAFIDLEAALESYCSITIEESAFENGKLTLSGGQVLAKTPLITNAGETIACQEAMLVLSFNGEILEEKAVTLSQSDESGIFEADLDHITFDIPAMENEQQVDLRLNVTLTNGHILSAHGGHWLFNEEGLVPVLG